MSANCFKTDLEWSESQHSADWWLPYYHRAFPTLTSIQLVPGPSAAQKAGVDKFVTLEGGKRIAIDEKVRRSRAPTDICLEIEHVPTDESEPWPGWIAKPSQFTDYLAMGFCEHRTAFFFPFITLQTAWRKHGQSWVMRFGTIQSANPKINPRYHTHSVCVPTELLMGCLLDAMRIRL